MLLYERKIYRVTIINTQILTLVTMSEQLMAEYLSRGLLTNAFSFLEFKNICQRAGIVFDDRTALLIYPHLQSLDKEELDGLEANIGDFFQRARILSKASLESKQLQSSVSIESLVSSLYAADGLLDLKLSELDATISHHVHALDQLDAKTNELQSSGNIESALRRLTILLDEAEKAGG